MDMVTLGAALKGASKYVDEHFKAGSNIQLAENPDGSVTINASGEVSAEDTVAREALVEHVMDKDNPHEVTATQVGLGNVDNTSDLNKPISTAVQTALNTKVDKVSGKGLSTEDYTTAEKTKLASLENYDDTNIRNDISGKQAALTTTQLAAVNSGIDSTKVGQIATNTTNITNLQTAWAVYNSYSRPVVYGYRINADNTLDYLADAVGKTPAAMGASTFDYGDWQDAFFMPKPCMLKSDTTVAYYLDPDDYSKKTDGTASDVADSSFDGNAMMEWGLIWYKYYTGDDGGSYFLCSNVNVDGTYTCWCNTDSRGRITPHFYTAIYNGTGTTKLRSISGVALTFANGNGDTTVTQEIDRALANNAGSNVEWYTGVWCDRLLISSLLILIGKSLDTQATFGQGLVEGGQTAKEAYTTGTLNDKGLFWGDIAAGTSAVKVFGMENWWGCVWNRVAGCITVDYALKIKLTYGANDGSTTIGYNQTGDGYITNGTIPTTNNYVAKITYNKYGYMVSVVGSQANSPYKDYFYQNTGTRYLLVGGSSGFGVYAGAFYFALHAPSAASWTIGASLSCKPLV